MGNPDLRRTSCGTWQVRDPLHKVCGPGHVLLPGLVRLLPVAAAAIAVAAAIAAAAVAIAAAAVVLVRARPRPVPRLLTR